MKIPGLFVEFRNALASSSSLFEKLWLFAPILVWFSFKPLVSLGSSVTIHYQLSLALVFLGLLAAAALPIIWTNRLRLFSSKAILVVAAYSLFLLFSATWSADTARALVLATVQLALLLVIAASVFLQNKLVKKIPIMVNVFIIMAVFMSLLALVQFVAGIWLSQAATLLCNGCVVEQFGFSRPNAFTAEPQFFGNMLLVPVLIVLNRLFNRGKNAKYNSVVLFLLSIVLFLTISRGAIFSFVFAAGLLIVLNKNFKQTLKIVGIIVASGMLSLTLQGLSATTTPKAEQSFVGAVSASVNQLSLGRIDLEKDDSSSTEQLLPSAPTPATLRPPSFDGYVEESTDIRLSLSNYALRLWSSNTRNMLFGIGVGGSATSLQSAYPYTVAPGEIVQNQYLDVLLETGLVGFSLWLAIVTGLIFKLKNHKWLIAIFTAYLFQWNFFSGYPNALHIYLVAICLFVWATGPKVSFK